MRGHEGTPEDKNSSKKSLTDFEPLGEGGERTERIY
jgi:hypothetical protein